MAPELPPKLPRVCSACVVSCQAQAYAHLGVPCGSRSPRYLQKLVPFHTEFERFPSFNENCGTSGSNGPSSSMWTSRHRKIGIPMCLAGFAVTTEDLGTNPVLVQALAWLSLSTVGRE